METKQQRQLQFSDGADDSRQARYRRIAELVATGRVSTASHLFTPEAQADAERRAQGESNG